MKASWIVIAALLPAGCESSHKLPPLDAAHAQALALRLANDQADTLFHQRPFQDGKPPELTAGRWVWTGHRGMHLVEFEATVELAADGSTNSVKVQLLDDALAPMGMPPTPP